MDVNAMTGLRSEVGGQRSTGKKAPVLSSERKAAVDE
jgi:hypothetical protein